MDSLSAYMNRRVLPAVCVALWLGPFTAFVVAQPRTEIEPCHEPVIIGCGKGQAMVSSLAEDGLLPTPGPREAMTEDERRQQLDALICKTSEGLEKLQALWPDELIGGFISCLRVHMASVSAPRLASTPGGAL